MTIPKSVLLIIGNGFDLSYGLKTSYSDFLNSPEFKSIEEDSLASHMKAQLDIQNWVDLESELSAYCMEFYKIRTHVKGGRDRFEVFKEEYTRVKEQLKVYLRRITSSDLQINNNCAANKLLNDLCNNGNKKIDVITFNYTDTLDRISDYPMISVSAKVNHIHGSVDTDIVFGVEDSVNLKKSEVYLYKSYSKYKNTRPLQRLLSRYKNIIFFGYSLGDTDRQYFENYFYKLSESSDDTHHIAIYYFGANSYDDVKWQLQRYTKNNLSALEMNHDIQYLDCSNGYQKPRLLEGNKSNLSLL